LATSSIKEQQIHLKNTWTFKSKYQLIFGSHFSQYDVGHTIIKENRENSQTNVNRNLISNTQVVYTTLNLPFCDNFGINTGLRFSYFENEKQLYLEPRFRLWYQASDNLNLYLNVGRYSQFVSQLIQILGDDSSIETPVWVLAGRKEVPVLHANQFQIGGIIRRNGWTIDLQGYYKNISGLTSLATGFDDQIANNFELGNADIAGIDVLLKKRWKNYRTWVSYSLSRVTYHFPEFFDPTFPAAIEQPHSLHWVHLWKKNNWEFSLGWKGTSGTPYSLIDNFRVKINNSGQGPKESIEPVVNSFHSERLPFQHQMDASILYQLRPKNKKWKATFGMSVLNLYNQINLYQRSFLLSKPRNEPVQLVYTNKTDIGITPNVVVRINW